MTVSSPTNGAAANLRRAFDETFARPLSSAADGAEEMLLVRIGGDPYALRTRGLSGLVADKRIAAVPSRRVELLGIAGIRGTLLPVYSLTSLLGYGGQGAACRWLALSGDSPPVGLAFQGFDGFVRVGAKDVHAAEGAHAQRHVREVVSIAQAARPIVDVASILQSLMTLPGAARSIKEG